MLARASKLLPTCSSVMRQVSSSAAVLEGELATSSAEYASKVAAVTNNEPSYPIDFLKRYGAMEVGPSDGPTPSKIKLTFVAPHKILMSNVEVLQLTPSPHLYPGLQRYTCVQGRGSPLSRGRRP